MKELEAIKTNTRLYNIKVYEGGLMGLITLPDCGTATLVCGFDESGYEHVSIAPTRSNKMPTWKDMATLKDVFWEGEEEAFQLHPKKSKYVNIKDNCLHLWAIPNRSIDELATTGRWVESIHKETGRLINCHCSHCDYASLYKFKYCPECGCKMEVD